VAHVCACLHDVPPVEAIANAYVESRFDNAAEAGHGRGRFQVLCGPGRRWCSPLVWAFKLDVRGPILNAYEGARRMGAFLHDWRPAVRARYLCHYNAGSRCDADGRRHERRVKAVLARLADRLPDSRAF